MKITRFALDFDDYWQDFAYVTGPRNGELARAYEAQLKERLDPDHHGVLLMTELDVPGALPSVDLMVNCAEDNECEEWLMPSLDQAFEDGDGDDAIAASVNLHGLDERFRVISEADLRALGDVEGMRVVRWLNANDPGERHYGEASIDAMLEDAPTAVVSSRVPIPVAPGQQDLELGKEGKIE